MKTILIPTDYQEDTLQALENAAHVSGTEAIRVILLNLSPLSDSMTGLLFPPSSEHALIRQESLLKKWESRTKGIHLVKHHQYGASFPMLQQILELFEVNSIVIPFSIQQSRQSVHMEAVESLQKMDIEVVWMPRQVFATAL